MTAFLATYLLILPAITIEDSHASDAGISLEEGKQSKETKAPIKTESSQVSNQEGSLANQAPSTQASVDQQAPQKPEFLEGPLTYRGKDFTMTVTISPDAKISKDATLDVAEITQADVAYQSYKDTAINKVDKQESDIKRIHLYDIRLLDKSGEIEPSAPVKVEVSYDKPLKTEQEKVKVVHFKDDGQTEVLGSKITDETKTTSSDVAFKTDSFSVYAIIQEDGAQVPIATYHFENTDGSDYTFLTSSGQKAHEQLLRDQDTIKAVGIPIVQGNQHFNGWFTYDKTTNTYGEQVYFETPIPVTKTEDIYVRPSFGAIAHVTLFDDEEGKIILQKQQVVLNQSGVGTIDLTEFSVVPPKATEKFAGWSTSIKGTPIRGDEAKNYKVTQDVKLYPIFKESKKVEFNTGDLKNGSTYIAPKLVLVGDTAASIKPPDPTRPNYKFAGWYTAATGGNAYNFDSPVNTDLTLYAHWTPASTKYTVVFWQQSATDNKAATDDQKTYEYTGQETRYGLALSSVALTTSDKTPKQGFKLNTIRTQISDTVKDDGSTVLNVYFDRKLITMQFLSDSSYINYYGIPALNNSIWSNPTYVKTISGLYGTSLQANNYNWPNGNYAWTYYASGGGSGGMSFLGDFILPSTVATAVTGYEDGTIIRLYPNGTKTQTYRFYKQNLDGSYNLTPTDVGIGYNASLFTFTEKYTGFSVALYRRLYYDTTAYEQYTNVSDGNKVGLNYNYYDNTGYYRTGYLGLDVRFERKSYQIHYLDPFDESELPNFPTVSVKYEAAIALYKPNTQSEQPIPNKPGYEWDGKWYKDKAQTEEVSWTGTMPAHDLKVYAGWKKILYKITIDPGMGQLNDSEKTYFELGYGEKIPEYSDITRNYVEDPSGTYYYRYDTRSSATAATDQRNAHYTTDSTEPNIDKSKRYKREDNTYQLVGWYYVNDDGSIRPYTFSGAVTKDINLRAVWRKVGEYHITYSNDAVTTDGKELKAEDGSRVQTSNAPTDPNSYDDQSSSSILHRPTIPNGYRYRGWYYNGQLYNPYDAITVLANLADANKSITVYPALIPISSIALEDTHLTFDANGGKTLDGKDTTVLDHLLLNSTVNALSADKFIRVGYELIGWNHSKDLANEGEVEFTPGQTIGIDNQPDVANTLYAVWKPKEYTVTITKKVVGLDEDKTKDFVFSPSDTLQQENFGLKDGETKTFTKVPYGASVKVDEQEYKEFDSKEEVKETNLADGSPDKTFAADNRTNFTVEGNVAITFTNTRKAQNVRLQKVSIEDLSKPLMGASFDISQADANGAKKPTPLYSNVVAGDNGYLRLDQLNEFQLPLGKYFITETKAPDGYQLAPNDMIMLVTSSGVTLSQDNNASPLDRQLTADQDVVFNFKITNSRGTELPSTGGIGKEVFILIGLALIIPSATILYKRRKNVL
nr:InlB B-repeat-containing protein [Streptococcus didelphis]